MLHFLFCSVKTLYCKKLCFGICGEFVHICNCWVEFSFTPHLCVVNWICQSGQGFFYLQKSYRDISFTLYYSTLAKRNIAKILAVYTFVAMNSMYLVHHVEKALAIGSLLFLREHWTPIYSGLKLEGTKLGNIFMPNNIILLFCFGNIILRTAHTMKCMCY